MIKEHEFIQTAHASLSKDGTEVSLIKGHYNLIIHLNLIIHFARDFHIDGDLKR